MRIPILLAAAIAAFSSSLLAQDDKWHNGFIDFKYNDSEGTVLLDVAPVLDREILYVSSLSAGVGSNDIGLDRNQLGPQRMVKFIRRGNKVLLEQQNHAYRALSENPAEVLAVEEAFARSVIGGFEVEEDSVAGKVIIDITDFLLRDAHDIAGRLRRSGQGNYNVDLDRSAINPDRTANFPMNTEFDAIVTLSGEVKGTELRSVTPDPDAVTVGVHHSFIELPDDNYVPRKYDARSGFYPVSFADYAAPIDQPLVKKYLVRHRLEKKDPGAEMSEPVEPIIYYIDRGCPEPIKTALIEGAQWWNQAFEHAGYINAFRVEELPQGADPMDVRYNMINWVHRSTRGWSYGSSVVDPRTGEILKGHVLLGSLRVRQDFLIAQGLASIFEEGDEDPQMLVEMALARLKQLSAHEVGHTLGLQHNFAASGQERASVMDYPHPYITTNADGEFDFSDAYANGIGTWDKRAILYGYQDFPEGADEELALDAIISETIDSGFNYISDNDARPAGGAHPGAHLWDNGVDPVDELERLSELRAQALSRFGVQTIPNGTELAHLEALLVPLYLNHRYQVEAVSKLIGGVNYTYKMRGDAQAYPEAVPKAEQVRAVEALIQTLEPGFLRVDGEIAGLIPPPPPGYGRTREYFKSYTGLTFDPLAAAESSVHHSLDFMLNPDRLARILNQSMYDTDQLGLGEYLNILVAGTWEIGSDGDEYDRELQRLVQKQVAEHLIEVAANGDAQPQVRAMVVAQLNVIKSDVERAIDNGGSAAELAHLQYVHGRVEQFLDDPEEFEPVHRIEMPPGSPIGCGGN